MKFKDILGFVVGPLGAAALGILVIPATTWVFSAEDVGRLNVSQLAINLGLLLCSLGLDQSYVREFHHTEKKPALLLLCAAPGLAFIIFLGLLTIPFSKALSGWLYELREPRLYYLLYGCTVIAFVSRFLSLVLRMQERGFAYAATQVFPKAFLLVLLCAIWGIFSAKDFFYLQGANFLASALVLALMIFFTRAEWRVMFRERISFDELRPALGFGIPLVFSALAFWGLTASGTTTLRAFSTLSEVAVYSVAVSLAGVASIFQAIFSVMWAPILYKWVERSEEAGKINIVARRTLAVALLVFFACGSLSWVVDYILPPQYSGVKYLLLCTILQPILYTVSEVTCVGIGITRRTVFSVWIALAAMAMNLIFCVLLVPSLGAAGAAIANTLGFLVFFVLRTEISARIWRVYPMKKVYVALSFASILAICQASMGPMAGAAWSLISFLMLPLSFLLFKNEWSDLYGLAQRYLGARIRRGSIA